MFKITLSLLMLSSFAFAESKCVEHHITYKTRYTEDHLFVLECKMPNNDICYFHNPRRSAIMSCVSHKN